MLGHGAKFGQKREQAIAALLSHRSVEEAAREVGISANTLLRWMKEPEFQTELREARRTVFTQAIGRLQDAAGAAATTVLKIMLDTNVPEATRLRATNIVFDQAAKGSEREDLEDRAAKLELTAGLVTKSGKSSADLTWLSAASLPLPVRTQAQIAAPIDNEDSDKNVVG